MIKLKSDENFLSPKIFQLRRFRGLAGIRGVKSNNFTAIDTFLLESMSFEPLCVKLCWGLTSRAEIEIEIASIGCLWT